MVLIGADLDLLGLKVAEIERQAELAVAALVRGDQLVAARSLTGRAQARQEELSGHVAVELTHGPVELTVHGSHQIGAQAHERVFERTAVAAAITMRLTSQ